MELSFTKSSNYKSASHCTRLNSFMLECNISLLTKRLKNIYVKILCHALFSYNHAVVLAFFATCVFCILCSVLFCLCLVYSKNILHNSYSAKSFTFDASQCITVNCNVRNIDLFVTLQDLQKVRSYLRALRRYLISKL